METKRSASILSPALCLFVIALAASLLLALVQGLTAERIHAQELEAEAAARFAVFPAAASFREAEGCYEALDAGGSLLGYVFRTEGESKGYGGPVSVSVGIGLDGVLTGVLPADLSKETPGLGQNAGKPAFLDQFRGLSGAVSLVKNAPKEGEVQAVTSATITSTAVTSAVNKALSLFDAMKGGAQ